MAPLRLRLSRADPWMSPGDGFQSRRTDVKRPIPCLFWLAPVALAWNHGFSPRELNEIRRLVLEHEPSIIEAWHEHCGER
jgi:hypothetical protein